MIRARMPLRRLFALALLCATLAGCAASSAYRRGEKAERREDWDRAVIEYVRAVSESPGNTHYSVSLARAKLKASAYHFELGKRYAAAGQLDLAVAEFEQTILLDPANDFAMNELDKVQQEIRRRQMSPSEIELAKARAKKKSLAPPLLSPTSNIPITLKFKEQPIGKIYEALSKASGINFLYDERVDLKETKTVEIAGVSFEKAMDILMLQNKHFFKVIDERTILLAPDNRQKRQEYEDRVIRTFYLSNAETKQVNTLLRSLLDARKVAENQQLNSLTINGSPDLIAVAEKIIEMNDKSKAELIINVELLELNRTKLRELGLDLTSKGLTLAFGQGNEALSLNDLRQVEQASNWSIGPVPGLSLSFAKTYTDSKTIAKPQLRVTEGEKAQIHIGDRIPIPTTTFNTANTVGGNIVPVTSFTYQNVGIEIDLEPRVHHNREITLKINVTVSTLAGSIEGTGGISQPIIGQRQIQTVIRLKDGETNLLAGLIREEDTRSLSGVPGLSDIPILNRIFGRNSDQTQKTDIVLTITPYIIRIPDIRDSDLETIWVGTQEQLKLRSRPSNAFGQTPFGVEEDEGAQPTVSVPPSASQPDAGESAGSDRPGRRPGAQRGRRPGRRPPTPAPPETDVEDDEGFYEGDDEFDEDFDDDFEDDEFVPEDEFDEEGDDEAGRPPSQLVQVILSSPKTAYEVGDQVPVSIRVIGGANVGSIPFHLRFDQQVLDFIGPAVEGDFLGRDGTSTIFVANQVEGSGELVVGATRVGGPPGAEGAGVLASFMFVAKAPGPVNFSFTGAAVKDPNANNLPAQFTVAPVSIQ